MEDQTYLEPSFDPATLTVPRLRSILVAHSIDYPSSAKKGQLIDLFNEHVRPQARRIRSANARVKRTSRGIEDVPAAPSTDASGAEDDDVAGTTPAAVRRSRRTTRARTEEAQEVAPTPRALRHTTAPPEATPRRTSSKHARASRLEAATPVAAKHERDDEGSPFSSENVFQSGGSPPASRRYDPERRRTAAVPASRDPETKQSREVRRRTDGARPLIRKQVDGVAVPARTTVELPVSRLQAEDGEPPEEFIPEEEQELVQAESAGELVPARPRPRRPVSGAVRTAPWAITVAMLLGLVAVWRQEKLDVGYCGVGRPSTEVAGVQIPDWADFVRPQCEPCPPHAFCGEQLQTHCEPDFVLTRHPLSFGGLVPLPPTCEPDSAKARKVEAVKARAVDELRVQNAKYECGQAASPEVGEPELKQAIGTQRRKGMTDEEFEDLWASALGEIQNADEVLSGADGSGHFTLRSTSLARLSLGCAIRRSLRETLRQHIWKLVGTVLIVSSAAYGRQRVVSGRETEATAKQLAGLALEKLSQQAALHAWDPESYREDYISVAQLRDDVLRNEFSATRRKKLWERVQHKVESNANVRPLIREGRRGDVGRVWEWVGAVGLMEAAPSSPSAGAGGGSSVFADRRKSRGNRISFGGLTEDKSIAPSSGDEADTTPSVSRKWEESRPYY